MRRIIGGVVALGALITAGCGGEVTDPNGVMGTTPGWFDGRTVEFAYTDRQFFCDEPPESGAQSGCEMGARPATQPRTGTIPPVWVLVPLEFTPASNTLHCPTAGSCITHPATLDVSRVFGPGTEAFTLPAHSHIIDNDLGGAFDWWEVIVVGVTQQPVWDQLVAGRSIGTLRQMQAAGAGITQDIPSNLYLWFAAR